MRTPKPRPIISRPAVVVGVGAVPKPTIRLSRSEGSVRAVVTFAPEGARLDLLVGATPRDRELVGLRDYLRERAATDDDLSDMLARVPSYRGGITPELTQLAQAYVDSERRQDRQNRRPHTRAECFHRLCVALNIVGLRTTPDSLKHEINRAMRRIRDSKLPPI